MKIALIGASGFVGTAILKEALERGHSVIAIARDTDKIAIKDSNITPYKADVMNENEVTESVKGSDVVVNAFNAGWTNPNLYNDFLNGSKSIEAGVKKSGIKRFIVVGGAGSLYIAPDLQLIDTPEFPAAIKPGALAARDYLNILKNDTDLDWTFLSPAIEMHQGTSGERKGVYRSGLENPVFDEAGRSTISVEDIAVAIVDEIENPRHIRERFTVAY